MHPSQRLLGRGKHPLQWVNTGMPEVCVFHIHTALLIFHRQSWLMVGSPLWPDAVLVPSMWLSFNETFPVKHSKHAWLWRSCSAKHRQQTCYREIFVHCPQVVDFQCHYVFNRNCRVDMLFFFKKGTHMPANFQLFLMTDRTRHCEGHGFQSRLCLWEPWELGCYFTSHMGHSAQCFIHRWPVPS